MMKSIIIAFVCLISCQWAFSQNFGNFPVIGKEKLLNDLDLLYQGLDKFHSGMYWYTPKDSVDMAFQEVRMKITDSMNVFEFHRLIAPLVALTREDHTNIYLPESTVKRLTSEARFMPLTVVFLGRKLFCVKNGSDFEDFDPEGMEIESVNGETPQEIVRNIGMLFASDGYIKTVKYSDLEGFGFSRYYYYHYGRPKHFEVKFKEAEAPVVFRPLEIDTIRNNLTSRHKAALEKKQQAVLTFEILNDDVAYLGIHTFSNDDIRAFAEEKRLKVFLRNSFKALAENAIPTVVVDVGKNTGGSEGNEGLLYSYFGDNYQKYKKVRVKTQKAVLDNGSDRPIVLKAFGIFERLLANKKMEDGSLERRSSLGKGLMAYKKAPKYPFHGKTYVIISPATYSGGSEFSNMMYSQGLATFVGQETGGGYFGNTSGYSKRLELPHSKIQVSIPALQFVMNVNPSLPFGRGVIPHHQVVPSFDEYVNGVNTSLQYILEVLEKE